MAPWSGFWDRNFFAARLPSLEIFLSSAYARGAVSGVGLITLLAGIAEAGGAFASRRSSADPRETPTFPSER